MAVLTDKMEYLLINPLYIKNGGNVAKARVLIRKCFERFFYIKEKLYFLGDGCIYTINKNVKALKNYLELYFNADEIYFSYEKKLSNGKIKTETILILDVERLLNYLVFSQVVDIYYRIDFFIDKPTVKRKKYLGGDKMDIIFNEFVTNDILKIEVTDEEKKEIIADYYDHFPDFDLFMDFVAAARFAADRKATYLHLHTRSNWGKSFLMGIFKDLGLGYEIRYSDIAENKPVGVNPIEVLNSIVLFLDEFKYFSKEMKKITNEMTIEPKFGFKSTVPVYAKVLLSAEESASFKDGVDEQILNRVIKIDYSDSNKFCKLNERKVYLKYGGEVYFNVIANYVKDEMIKRIMNYIKMGRRQASFEAEKVLRKMAKEHKLEVLDLETEILEVFIEFFEKYKFEINSGTVETSKYSKFVDSIYLQSDEFLVLRPQKTLSSILKMEVDEDFFAKAKYKIPLIKDLVGVDYGNRRIQQLNNKGFKVLTVDLKVLRFKLLNKNKTFEFENYKIEFENFEDLAIKINELVKDLYNYPNFKQKLNELKETIENYGLTQVFVLNVDEQGNFYGVEYKKIKPDEELNDDVPF